MCLASRVPLLLLIGALVLPCGCGRAVYDPSADPAARARTLALARSEPPPVPAPEPQAPAPAPSQKSPPAAAMAVRQEPAQDSQPAPHGAPVTNKGSSPDPEDSDMLVRGFRSDGELIVVQCLNQGKEVRVFVGREASKLISIGMLLDRHDGQCWEYSRPGHYLRIPDLAASRRGQASFVLCGQEIVAQPVEGRDPTSMTIEEVRADLKRNGIDTKDFGWIQSLATRGTLWLKGVADDGTNVFLAVEQNRDYKYVGGEVTLSVGREIPLEVYRLKEPPNDSHRPYRLKVGGHELYCPDFAKCSADGMPFYIDGKKVRPIRD